MQEKNSLYKVSEYFDVDPSKFEEYGILDPLISVDVPLFLNPKLIEKCDIPEFKKSKDKIIKHYEVTIALLQKTNFGDPYWQALLNHYSFPEPSGVGLGTSLISTNGNGLTGITAEKCLRTLKSIVDLEIYDPTMYKLLFLVQENVGVDRISDMICRIIYEDLEQYSNNMIEKLNIENYQVDEKTGLKYLLRPNGKKLILLPADLLSEIPDIVEYGDIDALTRQNQEIKEYMCDFFGEAYLNVTKFKDFDKEKLRNCIINNKETILELLGIANTKEASVYDYTHDPLYISSDLKSVGESIDLSGLLSKSELGKCVSLHEFIGKLLKIYKKCIEDLGLNNELYYYDKSKDKYCIRREQTSHLLFLMVLEVAKTLKFFDFAFEAKAGNGQVEFVIFGNNEKIILEFKLSKNDLVHGYDHQLKEYIKRFKPTSSFYVIIKVKDNDAISNFYKNKQEILDNCEIVEIDGLLKLPPSSKDFVSE